MGRSLFIIVPIVALMAGGLLAADDKDKKDKEAPKPFTVTIVKVDGKKGEITLKYPGAKGQEQEKKFQLTEGVRFLDETGRPVHLDFFEAGNDVFVVESEGTLKEIRRATTQAVRQQRLSDHVLTLIEMTDCEEGCTEEVQRIYDMLRKLDTAKNGKIDPTALKAEADKIVNERVKGIFDRLDTDKDGKISKEEAKGLIKEHFDKIDTNKDGFIDFDELLKAAKEKRDAKAAEKGKE
jgi:Ca2+-binding EF-hand superfamily protein